MKHNQGHEFLLVPIGQAALIAAVRRTRLYVVSNKNGLKPYRKDEKACLSCGGKWAKV